MRITCPQCRLQIVAEDVHLDTGLAKCRRCDSVFDFNDQVPRPAPESRPSSETTRPRESIAQPPGVAIVDDGWGGLTITRRWFSPVIVFLLFFVIFWDGFLVLWYTIGLSDKMEGDGIGKTIMLVFPVLHVAVGVGLTYFVITGFVNKSTIQCRDDRFSLRHGPLPWPGSCDLDAADLEQLYVKEKINRGRNGSTQTYQLRLKTRGGRDLKLLSGLSNPDQALYIERQIEEHLSIEDRPVRGEMR